MQKKILYFLFLAVLAHSEKLLAQTPEDNLKKLGITLTMPQPPIASYVNCVRVGNLLYLSGKGPLRPDGTFVTGKVGRDINADTAYYAARLIAISHLSLLKQELGSLSRVKRIVKVLGMVNCTDQFIDQPKVINGYSDLMVEVFGDKGKHARSAVGVNSLPFNIAVEVEVIVEIRN